MDVETEAQSSSMIAQCHMAGHWPRQNSDLLFLGKFSPPHSSMRPHLTLDHLDVFLCIWVLCSYGSFRTFSLNSTNVWGTGRDDADNNRVDTHFALWTALLKFSGVTAHTDNCNIFKAQSGKLECTWSK